MTASTVTTKKQGIIGDLKYKIFHVACISGDTTATITTLFRRVLWHGAPATAVATKYVSRATVSGGTITLTIVDPLADSYFEYMAISDT